MIGMLLPFIILIGAMFLMTRSARTKQKQATEMRAQMAPGSGVRTIGGMYAVVKEVHDDVVLLELTDGVHAHFAKNAIGAVLDEAEFNRIVHGIDPDGDDEAAAPGPDGTGDTPAGSGAADAGVEGVKLSKAEDTDVTDDAPKHGAAESR